LYKYKKLFSVSHQWFSQRREEIQIGSQKVHTSFYCATCFPCEFFSARTYPIHSPGPMLVMLLFNCAYAHQSSMVLLVVYMGQASSPLYGQHFVVRLLERACWLEPKIGLHYFHSHRIVWAPYLASTIHPVTWQKLHIKHGRNKLMILRAKKE
jgi:hypothetical protein